MTLALTIKHVFTLTKKFNMTIAQNPILNGAIIP